MWNRLISRKIVLDREIKFIDGLNIDNIPFNQILLGEIKNFYLIDEDFMSDSLYHRRLLSRDGAVTSNVLFNSLDIPSSLFALYNELRNRQLLDIVKVPFFSLFNLCYYKHSDPATLFAEYKKLLQLLQPVLHNSKLYTSDDKYLANLLIHSGFYDFHEKFTGVNLSHKKRISFKLFGLLKFFELINIANKRVYKLFGIPVLKIYYTEGAKVKYMLFGLFTIFEINSLSD